MLPARYARIAHALRTIFNAEDGLSPEVSKELYLRAIANSPSLVGLKSELEDALSDPSVSWKEFLCNEQYEVFDAQNEQQAREFASALLLASLQEGQ